MGKMKNKSQQETPQELALLARRLERERIMELFEAIKADVYRHVPSGADAVAVQEAFQRFEEAVASCIALR